MKKAVLTNKILLDITPELKDKLVKTLTYKILTERDQQLMSRGVQVLPEVIRTYSIVSNTVMAIPSGRLDLVPEDYEIVDNRIKSQVEFPEIDPQFVLRPDQQEIYDQVKGSCIINAKVSWGKTFAGLFISRKLGCKTIIIVHTRVLLDQWATEVQKLFGIKPRILGKAGEEDSPITISTIQTLSKRIASNPVITYEYGTVIMDEVHHLPARTFYTCLSALRARYKIGLSGTLERKDGKHVLLRDFFGPVVYKPLETNSMKPNILIVKTNLSAPSLSSCNNSWANVITQLNDDPRFIELLAKITIDAVDNGHKALVVCERVQSLYRILSYMPDIADVVESQTKNRDEIHSKIISGELSALLGSVNIYSEGVSVNPLSCLVLGVQTNNKPLLTQLIGRVTRLYEGKPNPLVIDIVLDNATMKRQHMTRLGHYMEKGYSIETIEIIV
jgi:superfamily II DNA or RNA helicase